MKVLEEVSPNLARPGVFREFPKPVHFLKIILAVPAREIVRVLKVTPGMVLQLLFMESHVFLNQAFISLRKAHLIQIAYYITISHITPMPGQVTALCDIALPVNIKLFHLKRRTWEEIIG